MRNVKVYFFIFFLTIFCGQLSGQSRIGFKLLPGLTVPHNPDKNQNFQNIYNPRFTFNFGGLFIHSIMDSTLFIETGFYYTDRGNLQKDFVSRYTTPQGSFTKTSDIYIHNYYFSLPILFRIERKYFYASAGITLDYYSHTKWVFTPEEDKIEKSDFLKSFSDRFKLGTLLTIGTHKKLTKRLGLFVEGHFNPNSFDRNPINKQLYFYWNYLLGTGLTFKL
jgi:hypothetical protein